MREVIIAEVLQGDSCPFTDTPTGIISTGTEGVEGSGMMLNKQFAETDCATESEKFVGSIGRRGGGILREQTAEDGFIANSGSGNP